MKLDLSSIQLSDNVHTVVCIDYDNKTQRFGRLSELASNQKEDERKLILQLMKNIQLFVFQGPDPALAVPVPEYPEGTVVYELPSRMMKRTGSGDQPVTPQASDNQIVMFITALGQKLRTSGGLRYGRKLTVCIVSGGDRRYNAVQQLATEYFEHLNVKIVDSERDSILSILPEDVVCTQCKVVCVGSYGPTSKQGHREVVCAGCNARYCSSKESEHAVVQLTLCARSQCNTRVYKCCKDTAGAKHNQEHESQGDKVCTLCPEDQKKWLSLSEYMSHMEHVHHYRVCHHQDVNGTFCRACLKPSEFTAHVLKHIEDVRKERPDHYVFCPECLGWDAPSRMAKNFRQHFKERHPEAYAVHYGVKN